MTICCLPECCIVCRDNFNRPDSSDISDGATCDWSWTGSASIEGGYLKIPAGGSVTGPLTDRVIFRCFAAASGNQAKVSIGDVTAEITFGLDANNLGHIKLTGDEVVNAPIDIFYDNYARPLLLCVGKAGAFGGAEFRFSASPNSGVSAQLSAEPATPYGALKFETISGTVWFDSASLSYSRSAERPNCTQCHARTCNGCIDESIPDDLSLTNCRLTVASGTWYFGETLDSLATLRTQEGNSENRPIMIVTATWQWYSSSEGDPVRVYVAWQDAANNHFVEFIPSNGTVPNCTKLCRQVAGSVSILTQNTGGFTPWNALTALVVFDESTGLFYLNCADASDGNELSSTVEVGAGPYAAFGTGILSSETLGVALLEFSLDWYAQPNRPNCFHFLRPCGAVIQDRGPESNDPIPECYAKSISGTWNYHVSAHGYVAGFDENSWLQFLTAHPDRRPAGHAVFSASASKVGTQAKVGWRMSGGAAPDYLRLTVLEEVTSPYGGKIQYDLVIAGTVVASATRDFAEPDGAICIGEGVIRVTVGITCGAHETIFRYPMSYGSGSGPFWGVGIGDLGAGETLVSWSFQLDHAYEDRPRDPYAVVSEAVCEPCLQPRIGGTCLAPRTLKVVIAGLANADIGDPACDCDVANGIFFLPATLFYSEPLYSVALDPRPQHCTSFLNWVTAYTSAGDLIVRVGTRSGIGIDCDNYGVEFRLSLGASLLCGGEFADVDMPFNTDLSVGACLDSSGATCTVSSA